MIDTPSTWRKPAAKMNSQSSGLTSEEMKRSRWLRKRKPFADQNALQADEIVAEAEALGAPSGMTPVCRACSASGALMTIASGAGGRLPAAQPGKCLADRFRAVSIERLGDGALGDQIALGKHHDVVAVIDLVDQMRRPEDADALRSSTSLRILARMPARDWTSSPTVASSSSSSGGRCSRARAISMRRIWPPDRLRALSCRRPLISTVSQHGIDAPARLGGADAVQRGMVGEVLVDAEVEIERARLEDDAEAPQRLARARG